MIKINDMFRGIVLNPKVLEAEDVKLKAEEYGLSYQNSNMRVECYNNDENDSCIAIEIFGNEEHLANIVNIRKQVKDGSEAITFSLVIPGYRNLGSITFKYEGNHVFIDISTINNIGFRYWIINDHPGIAKRDSREDNGKFIGVGDYSTEYVLNEIHAEMCNIDAFDEDCNRMLAVIRPALVLNILAFNEKFLNMIERGLEEVRNVPCDLYTAVDRKRKEIIEDDYHYFVETFESEVPNTIKVKK